MQHPKCDEQQRQYPQSELFRRFPRRLSQLHTDGWAHTKKRGYQSHRPDGQRKVQPAPRHPPANQEGQHERRSDRANAVKHLRHTGIVIAARRVGLRKQRRHERREHRRPTYQQPNPSGQQEDIPRNRDEPTPHKPVEQPPAQERHHERRQKLHTAEQADRCVREVEFLCNIDEAVLISRELHTLYEHN